MRWDSFPSLLWMFSCAEVIRFHGSNASRIKDISLLIISMLIVIPYFSNKTFTQATGRRIHRALLRMHRRQPRPDRYQSIRTTRPAVLTCSIHKSFQFPVMISFVPGSSEPYNQQFRSSIYPDNSPSFQNKLLLLFHK